MKSLSVYIEEAGPANAMQLIDVDLPASQASEVQIKVYNAGVAGGDVARRSGVMFGSKFPYYPGYDVVGEVVAVGANVGELCIGQIVCSLCMAGGYSEYVNVPAAQVIALPDPTMDPVLVSAALLNYVTAYQMLFRVARVSDGGTILVHGAAGGVGTALLQLAKLHNIKVYGTASSGKHETIRAEGGLPIDYKSQDFVAVIKASEPQGLDAAFDPVGGTQLWRSYRTLKRGGALVAYGILSAADNPLNGPRTFATLAFARLRVKTAFYGISNHNAWYREDVAHILDLLAQGHITPIVAETLPLREASRAHTLLERSAVKGKIVLQVT